MTSTMPVANPDLEELIIITIQPCVSDGSQSYDPSPAMSDTVNDLRDSGISDKLSLIRLLHEIPETEDKANDTYNAIKHWMSAFSRQAIIDVSTYVKNTLQIPLTQHSGLSAEENSRLHVLLQFSVYVHFLKKLENDSALGSSGIAIRELRLKIMQANCTLRKLLHLVQDTSIKAFAEQDLSGHIISLVNQRAALKRAVCCVAVSMMLDTFTRTEVYVDSGSVFISENMSG